MSSFKVPAPRPKQAEASPVELISAEKNTSSRTDASLRNAPDLDDRSEKTDPAPGTSLPTLKVEEEPAKEDPPSATLPAFPYEPPEWSGLPNQAYYLEVIKEGSSLPSMTLPQSHEFLIIGRLPFCHIVLDHPSISRFHAVIQFDKSGAAWLMDLKSPHGTRIGKKQLSPYVPVQLKYQDVIQFGASTRIYVFRGDASMEEQYELELLQKEEAKQTRRAQLAAPELDPSQASTSLIAEGDDDGISWGIDFSVEEAIYEHQRQEEARQRHRKRKELDAERQVEDEEDEEADDMNSFDASDSSDDDFYDKTKKCKRQGRSHDGRSVVKLSSAAHTTALSYEDLLKKRDQLTHEARFMEQKLNLIQRRLSGDALTMQQMDDDEQDVENVLQRLARASDQQDYRHLRKALISIQEEQKKTEKLIDLLKPSKSDLFFMGSVAPVREGTGFKTKGSLKDRDRIQVTAVASKTPMAQREKPGRDGMIRLPWMQEAEHDARSMSMSSEKPVKEKKMEPGKGEILHEEKTVHSNRLSLSDLLRKSNHLSACKVPLQSSSTAKEQQSDISLAYAEPTSQKKISEGKKRPSHASRSLTSYDAFGVDTDESIVDWIPPEDIVEDHL